MDLSLCIYPIYFKYVPICLEKSENHSILYQYCDVIPWNNVEEALIELGEEIRKPGPSKSNPTKKSSTPSPLISPKPAVCAPILGYSCEPVNLNPL